jgi:hypothetical protein
MGFLGLSARKLDEIISLAISVGCIYYAAFKISRQYKNCFIFAHRVIFAWLHFAGSLQRVVAHDAPNAEGMIYSLRWVV